MRHSSSTLGQTERLDQWSYASSSICGEFVTIANDTIPFFGDIRRDYLGALEFAHISCNAKSIRQRKLNADRNDDRYYFLLLQRAGDLRVTTGGENILLRPGEMALVDSTEGFEMYPQSSFQQVSMHLQRDLLTNYLPQHRVRSGKIPNAGLSSQLLKTLAQRITGGHLTDNAASTDGMALQESLIRLSQSALDPSATNALALLDGHATLAMRARAEKVINDMLDQHGLSPSKVACTLGISVRQLYRLFQGADDGVHSYILKMRLERCAQQLIDQELAHKSITDISLNFGFNDSAHFSRAFKQRYGASPRDYRKSNQVGIH